MLAGKLVHAISSTTPSIVGIVSLKLYTLSKDKDIDRKYLKMLKMEMKWLRKVKKI